MKRQVGVQQSTDEISLLELFSIFWRQKWLILIVTLVTFGAGYSYILFTKPTYQSTLNFTLPNDSDLSLLRAGSISEKIFNLRELFNIFNDSLTSEPVKELFFKQIYLPSLSKKQQESTSEAKLFKAYSKAIVIKTNQQVERNLTTLSIKTDDSQKSIDWARQYLLFAEEKANFEFLNLIKRLNLVIAKKIALLKQAKETVQKEVSSQLKAAIDTAKTNGIQNVTINLPATIFPDLDLLESEYNFYNKIDLSKEGIKLYQFSGSYVSVKPQKTLILLLTLFVGLILGFWIALTRNAYEKNTL